MGDYHLRMMFDIESTPGDVMAVLDNRAGIASWWSDKIEGVASAEGDKFLVSFPDAPAPFELQVTTLSDGRVEWFVAEVPPWWAGTTIRFDVMPDPDGQGSKLLFEHRDFDADSETIPIITPAWAQIVLRLKQVVETGSGDAFFKS